MRWQIKEHLCLPLLLKVPQLRNLDIRPQMALCRRAKPEVFQEKGYIFQADSQIKQVILILCGEVCSYKKDDGESGVPPQKISAEYLGEELLDRMPSKTSTPMDFPISHKHIKAVTKVEAFVLTVRDLREVWSQFEGHLYDSNIRNWAESVLRKGLRRRRLVKRMEMLVQEARANNPRPDGRARAPN
ncbi:hypothetical protein MLD38_009037 [Melastoma candidum]|uniref:Uncharacterized protein n=1 Tax=Melastoma candidum TaxID=119954 RepID=A0ACB9RZY3_9MYRT|nr:hypothetical protein MLD38_009037 [Melastoma candidum]